MAEFVFAYRVPRDYIPGSPETVAAWTAWFASMGGNLADQGRGVTASTSLGELGPDTRLGGYSVITASDLEATVALARGCPALRLGGGIEIGTIMAGNKRPRPSAGTRPGRLHTVTVILAG